MVILSIFSAFSVMGATGKPESRTKYEQAEEAYKAKYLNMAGELILEALRKEPNNAEYRFLLGLILFENGDLLGAKENFDIVTQTRFSSFKGDGNIQKLISFKKKVSEMQAFFEAEGKKKLEKYQNNQNAKDPLELATTLFQAFKLAPKLC